MALGDYRDPGREIGGRTDSSGQDRNYGRDDAGSGFVPQAYVIGPSGRWEPAPAPAVQVPVIDTSVAKAVENFETPSLLSDVEKSIAPTVQNPAIDTSIAKAVETFDPVALPPIEEPNFLQDITSSLTAGVTEVKDIFTDIFKADDATPENLSAYLKNLEGIRSSNPQRYAEIQKILQGQPQEVQDLLDLAGFYRDEEFSTTLARGGAGSIFGPASLVTAGAKLAKSAFNNDKFFEQAGKETGASSQQVQAAIEADKAIRTVTSKYDQEEFNMQDKERRSNERDDRAAAVQKVIQQQEQEQARQDLIKDVATATAATTGTSDVLDGDVDVSNTDLLSEFYKGFKINRTPISFKVGGQIVSFTPRAQRDELSQMLNFYLNQEKLKQSQQQIDQGQQQINANQPSTVDKTAQLLGLGTDLLGFWNAL